MSNSSNAVRSLTMLSAWVLSGSTVLALPATEEVRRAVDFAFYEDNGMTLPETGVMGELSVSLVQREVQSREGRKGRPHSVHDVQIGVLVGLMKGQCLLSVLGRKLEPSRKGLEWHESDSNATMLARVNLTSQAGRYGRLSESEWKAILDGSLEPRVVEFALCLAEWDIWRSQKTTTACLRSAGTILEDRRIGGRIPDTGGKYIPLTNLGDPDLEKWSAVDGWGRPILYKSNGDTFEVVSTGTDGALGPACSSKEFTTGFDPDCDIVYQAGGKGRVPPGISGW